MTEVDEPETSPNPPPPKFVGWSTSNSVRNGIPSVLAAAEVVVAVAIYWTIAIYSETYTPLWVSICIAPLLLLRSNQSIAAGATWFENYLTRREPLVGIDIASFLQSWTFWIGLLLSLISSAIIELSLNHIQALDVFRTSKLYLALLGMAVFIAGLACCAAIILPRPTSFSPSRAGSILGVLFTIGYFGELWSLAGALTFIGVTASIAKPRVTTLFVFSHVLGIWLRSIIIRFGATARFWKNGFWLIPANFQHSLFVVDIFTRADLVPGHNLYTTDGFSQRLKAASTFADKGDLIAARIFFLAPAYLYRLSIKSTCWLYLPLVYIASERYSNLTPHHLIDRLGRSPWEQARRTIAFLTLAGFAWVTITHAKISEFPNLKSISPVEFLFLLDFGSWKKPWQICSLLSALITFYISIAIKESSIDLAHENDDAAKKLLNKQVQKIKLLMRLRDASTAIFIVFLFVHALLLYSPLMGYLPTFAIQFLTSLYGEYMPSQPLDPVH